jgi:hypothetical protein
MRRTLASSLTIGVLAATSLSGSTASAYDGMFTHRWITRQAIAHVAACRPEASASLAQLEEEIAAGSEHEDDYYLDGDTDPQTLRVERHFYRPTDESGYSRGGVQFPSSFEWGATANEQNEWDWYDGLRRYQEGDDAGAFFTLGHVVHLLQDLTVPAHTQLKTHGIPDGDAYEDYCLFQMTDEHTSRLPTLPPGTPLVTFTDLRAAWQDTALNTYWRSLYRGDLADTNQPRGEISTMFPDLRWSWYSSIWWIGAPDMGTLGEDFTEEAPGWYYFKHAENVAAYDRAGAGPMAPSDGSLTRNAQELSMAALYARDLIPIAIKNSAALMVMFVDQAKSLPRTGAVGAADGIDPYDTGGCAATVGNPLLLCALIVTGALWRRARNGSHG